MRKIPTLFVRDEADRRFVTPKVTPGCEWVLAGEGAPTRKFDGTCVKLDPYGRWWARREVKPGKEPPANFVTEQHDPVTGKTVGWEPIEQTGWAKYHAEAIEAGSVEHHAHGPFFENGTYELVGPKVNQNPERVSGHRLVRHGRWPVEDAPRDYDGLREWMAATDFEGIVWHHPDGRMAKLKKRDFPA